MGDVERKMAAASSLGFLGADYTELDAGAGEGARPVPSVGGFGLSTLVVASRSGLARGGTTTGAGADVSIGMESGEPFLIAVSYKTASVPVRFGGVTLVASGGEVSAYAPDGIRGTIKTDGDETVVVFADFGNGSKSGALVVRTRTTMSVQRAEPTRCSVPRGTFSVPIERGVDAWVFYGDGERIAADAQDIPDAVVREAAVLAARECGAGSRPMRNDRSIYGLSDSGIVGSGAIAGSGLFAPESSGGGSGGGSGYGAGSGSGAWPLVHSARESGF
jgi:hypothetical protein